MKYAAKIILSLFIASLPFSVSPLSAQARGGGAASEVAETRAKGGKAWKTMLNRFDADGDKDLSPAETARYAEWSEKRKAIKGEVDANGNGRIDPDERPAFKEAVLNLNREYFVKSERSKAKGPGKKKGPGNQQDGADDAGSDEDDLSDIFGE